ncbi:MAG: bifunctional adenosylcobinamide kinase/adenosylcobinamide-phosphate guanylyltransferase [Anaerovoracaceae bacterium]|jgi:adenosylcobinamide kinase/adenosylcobinamide-phosphate guanylyltransferase
MNIFISGGCKNGKSHIAQCCARALAARTRRPLYYLATMAVRDEEDRRRAARHRRERRGWGFTTLEQPRDLCACLARTDVDTDGVFLLDSVTALLAEEMFHVDNAFGDAGAGARVCRDLQAFADRTGHAVFVSDFICGDAAPAAALSEQYRRALADADRLLAARCDIVVEVLHGCALTYRGGVQLRKLLSDLPGAAPGEAAPDQAPSGQTAPGQAIPIVTAEEVPQ